MNSVLSNLASGLFGAILGAIVSYVGNLSVETLRTRRVDNARRSALRLSLRLELDACLKSLNELKNALSSQSFYPFRWTEVLKKSAQRLEILRSDFYILDDDQFQEKLFTLVTDIFLFTNDVEAIEIASNKLNEDVPKWPNDSVIQTSDEITNQRETLKEQRRLKLVELVDLKQRLDQAARDLSK